MTDPIKIDVWSDIACPWCYIGKRNLEKGLAEASADDDAPLVDVTYHSFELSPDTPVDFEGDESAYLANHKGISPAQAAQMLERVTGVAAEAGLEYRFDLLKHTNTVKAHELLHFAKQNGRQLELVERLMSAYFTEGRHLGREDELVALATDVGLDADAARDALGNAALPRRRARRSGAGASLRNQRRAVLRDRRPVRRLRRAAARGVHADHPPGVGGASRRRGVRGLTFTARRGAPVLGRDSDVSG